MTYSWQIKQLVTRTTTSADGVELLDSVVTIHWNRVGLKDDGDTAHINGYTTLDTSNTASSVFVAFNDLTEETVIGWLDNEITPTIIEEYNSKIDAKMAKVDEVTRAVPWS